MGYTHYFRQHRAATSEQWAGICNDFTRLLMAAMTVGQSLPIQFEEDDPRPVEITSEHIHFNGIDVDAHDTMLLERGGSGFQFCKTARKPYDKAVVALLLFAHHHAPDVWKIGSDGDYANWYTTVTWLRMLGFPEYKVPDLD